MRIAIFAETFLPKFDGIANTLCYLLKHLAKRGHTSLMFAPQGAPARYANTPIIGLSSFRFPFYPDLKLVNPTFNNVERELAEFRPDVVHLVNPAILGLIGMRHANALDVPVVASYHTDIPGYAARYGVPMLEEPLWSYFRWIHNRADLNLCPSQYTRNELLEHGFERVRIWGRGVDMTRFNPSHRNHTWRERLTGGHPEKELLLYVGRLAVEKRIDWLRPVIDALPDARLAIVGDGPIRGDLEKLFEGTPTIFTGYLQGVDLSSAYAAGDLFVFPSASETFGNVVLEAMASGMPVIAPRAGGPVDHVKDAHNGFLFDPGSMDDLVHLTTWLYSQPNLWRRLGLSARDYAESQSWESLLDGLLKDYAEVAAKGTGWHSGQRQPFWADTGTSAGWFH